MILASDYSEAFLIIMYQKTIRLLSIFVGLFFIYIGISKHLLGQCISFGPNSSIPEDFVQLISTLCKSGYLKMVGILQVVGGLSLLWPRINWFGLILLTPISFVIFTFHLLLDNRITEMLYIGIPMFLLVFILYYEVNHKVGWKRLLK
jgi:putative oxidoreductase